MNVFIYSTIGYGTFFGFAGELEARMDPTRPADFISMQGGLSTNSVLTGIKKQNGKFYANFNSGWISVGDSVEGAKIVKITENEVDLSQGERRFKVILISSYKHDVRSK